MDFIFVDFVDVYSGESLTNWVSVSDSPEFTHR